MVYSIITNGADSLYGVKRIEFIHSDRKVDLCISRLTSEEEIQSLISEVLKESPEKTIGLMTREALGKYIKLPDFVLAKMAEMSIGTNFEYEGTLISRITNRTYNGRWNQQIAVRG